MQQDHPWTQEDLAGNAGISFSYVSLIERGRRIPPVHTLAAIAQALDVPITELLSRLDPKPSGDAEVVQPLSDFIQRRRLGSREVQRLLRVARLMFDQKK